jgi:hypothetical protein
LMNLSASDDQPRYLRWRKGAFQRCEEAAYHETRASQDIEIRQGRLDI